MENYNERLQTAVAQTGVTGASFAYWDGAALHMAAAGKRNSVTGDPVTDDTLLHVGSITKVFNATLLMQLVDDGKVALDDLVVKYLPDLKLGDVLRTLTVQMLINHTSGINCSMLADHGPDLERIEDAVARCAGMRQLFAPGEQTSYCNIGTVIAGHLTQTLRGESWYTLMKTRIFEPLGMRHALVDLTDIPRFRCSVGDLTDPITGKVSQTTRPYLPLSFAPAGTTNMMTASDLVTFGRALINGGVGPNGVRILSEASAKRMATPTASFVIPDDWSIGLGWMIIPGGVLTHHGGGPGVFSQLLAQPRSGRVMALLRNFDHGERLDPLIIDPILESWTGIKPAPKKEKPTQKADPKLYEGVYEMDPYRVIVQTENGGLTMRMGMSSAIYDNQLPPEKMPPMPMRYVGDNVFEVDGLTLSVDGEVRFVPGKDGRMRFLAPMMSHVLARAE